MKIEQALPVFAIVSRFRRVNFPEPGGNRSKSRRQPNAVFGNSAICQPQTGSFAPPPCDGFALERMSVNHGKRVMTLCLYPQTWLVFKDKNV
jgi:hypothetical protein